MISVIVPVYKVEKYLHRCVDSILNQTYKHLEVILVDDGSPDNCPAICDEYAKKDNRVKVIHQRNRGLSGARNAGLDIATGDYIAFVDSDDWIEPETYEVAVQKMNREDLDLVAFGFIQEYSNQSVHNCIIDDANLFVDNMMSGKGGWNAWRFLYRKEIFSDLRYRVGALYEDLLIIADVFDRVQKFGIVKNCFYHYNCENSQSIMHLSSKIIEDYVRFIAFQKMATYCQRYDRKNAYDVIMTKIYRIGIRSYIRNVQRPFW